MIRELTDGCHQFEKGWSEQERAYRRALAHLKQLQLRSLVVAMSNSPALSAAANRPAPVSDCLPLFRIDAA